ncbi:hypothetical protein O9929_26065 [Vibrio lentus]|nr:hypothetical protein [Vibrio lentus]
MAIDNKFIPGPGNLASSQALIWPIFGAYRFQSLNFLPKEWGGPVNPIEQMEYWYF